MRESLALPGVERNLYLSQVLTLGHIDVICFFYFSSKLTKKRNLFFHISSIQTKEKGMDKKIFHPFFYAKHAQKVCTNGLKVPACYIIVKHPY